MRWGVVITKIIVITPGSVLKKDGKQADRIPMAIAQTGITKEKGMGDIAMVEDRQGLEVVIVNMELTTEATPLRMMY